VIFDFSGYKSKDYIYKRRNDIFDKEKTYLTLTKITDKYDKSTNITDKYDTYL
jgi:hypothetical protein